MKVLSAYSYALSLIFVLLLLLIKCGIYAKMYLDSGIEEDEATDLTELHSQIDPS